ncbi:hypothetical protein UlMin_013415 [Ulmus minor]
MNGFSFNHSSSLSSSSSSQHPNRSLVNVSRLDHKNVEPHNHSTSLCPACDSSPPLREGGSKDISGGAFNCVFKFISEMLMEEDIEEEPWMLQDISALQAAEKSFYDVLGKKYPPSPDHYPFSAEKGGDIAARTNLVSPSGLVLDPSFRNGKNLVFMPEKDWNNSQNGSTRRKNQRQEHKDKLEEERSTKHSALYVDDLEPPEIFDKVLLNFEPSESKQTRSSKQENNKGVDLRTWLTQCAQAVASYDQTTAAKLLHQIKKHSSPSGDATQRLAYYFANGLEARLAGTTTQLYTPHLSSHISAVDMAQVYRVYLTACPSKKISFCYANQLILKLAHQARTIHIIDFGIFYGFQWPCFFQKLSQIPGGPPQLRITGIEFPQPGFRPSQRVEETGRRLTNYCRRFNIPFEYNFIAQRWETIQYEDLKIKRDELIIVNCLYRLRHLHDETVTLNNARDVVLNLIRRIKPKLFVHGVVNGSYNAPFLETRFLEAIYHFYALFDMFDASIPRENEERMKYEKRVYGRDIMNVVACEGWERVERPETYKQWQVRNERAGFKQFPLDQEIVTQVKDMVDLSCNKEFIVAEDGNWLLQGWKGRILWALSCWKPF